MNVFAAISPMRWSRASAAAPDDEDAELLARARAGDEQAFVALVARHHSAMLRLAAVYVPSRAVAEEVVQDTWLGVLRGLEQFRAQSTFRTWLLRILIYRARSTGVRERRSVAVGDGGGPAVDSARFDERGLWASPPEHWVEDADDRMLGEAMSASISDALDQLPQRQREVVLLRDVDGLSSAEICALLEISEGNQRVLLHRGRSHLRQRLEAEFGRA
ncbi:MAG TPA: RNA polymerase sigma factor [Solirubrobacteraceae bacterium]|nr:RNA polymerase sigma factor [Solirubrobacteraceae bacterium]